MIRILDCLRPRKMARVLPQTSYEILDNGRTIKLAGNAWKKLDYSVTITSESILTFEMKIDTAGEIHAIGFDDSGEIYNDDTRLFILSATDSLSNVNKDYELTELPDGWIKFEIPIGQYYTGTLPYLVLVSDDDANASTVSYFRNIAISDFTSDSAEAKAVTRYTYDANGNVIKTIDTAGNETWAFL